MKHIIAILLGLVVTGCATQYTRLCGTWKSDLNATMTFNTNHTVLTDQQVNVFSQMFGHLTVQYSPKGRGHMHIEPYSLTRGTNTFSADASSCEFRYRILGEDEDSVVVQSPGLWEDESIQTIHFESPTVYWIYIGENDLFGLHMREYFTKEK